MTTDDASDGLDERAASDRIGRYRVVGELAQGALASFYLALMERPVGRERLVAIKLIHEQYCRDELFMAVFLDEARIAARIRHPNVVPIYEIGEDRGRHFVAMDCVSGETLADVLRESRRKDRLVPVELAMHLVASAADGLHAAHELRDDEGRLLGVMHRDVSPDNLLIGYDGLLRIKNFGMAKVIDQLSSTQPGRKTGKLAYAAPEQLRALRLDRRVDVFALGVVLWESLIGKRLFEGSSDLATLERVARMPVPRPSMLREDCPEELDAIVMRALSRSLSERHACAQDLAQDLRRLLVARGRSVADADVEWFVRDVCHERYAVRMAMERRARAGGAGAQRLRPFRGSLSTGSDVDADEFYDISDIEAAFASLDGDLSSLESTAPLALGPPSSSARTDVESPAELERTPGAPFAGAPELEVTEDLPPLASAPIEMFLAHEWVGGTPLPPGPPALQPAGDTASLFEPSQEILLPADPRRVFRRRATLAALLGGSAFAIAATATMFGMRSVPRGTLRVTVVPAEDPAVKPSRPVHVDTGPSRVVIVDGTTEGVLGTTPSMLEVPAGEARRVQARAAARELPPSPRGRPVTAKPPKIAADKARVERDAEPPAPLPRSFVAYEPAPPSPEREPAELPHPPLVGDRARPVALEDGRRTPPAATPVRRVEPPLGLDRFTGADRARYVLMAAKCGKCHALATLLDSVRAGRSVITHKTFDDAGIKAQVVRCMRLPHSEIDKGEAREIMLVLQSVRRLVSREASGARMTALPDR